MSAPVVPSPGQIQIPPATRVVQGTVLNNHGSAVPNAIVLLEDTKTLQVRTFIADQQGKYHFFGLSTDVNYQVRAENSDMTSPIKLISVFDSHKFIKVDLKLKDKKKS